MNFMLNCPMRGSRALVTTPKLPLLKLPLGLLNCVWLNKLKNSARNSSAIDSVMRVSFCSAKSVLKMPGPWKNRRLDVPKRPYCCEANASGRK